MSGTESGEEMEVSSILGERKNKQGTWFLVRWSGFGPAEDTWEKQSHLTNAKDLIKQFREKMSQVKGKSKSRSRSRSRSTGRSRKRSRSTSKSRKSTPRKSSRSRNAETTTKVTTTSSPEVEETKTETITKSPGRMEQKTETITTSVVSPLQTRSTRVTRTTEVQRTYTTSGSSFERSKSGWRGWLQGCCQQVQDGCNTVADVLKSDYTALVVFSIISIIMLSFVIEKNVDFSKLWNSIVSFFLNLWNMLTGLMKSK